jgi:hypothetical protein
MGPGCGHEIKQDGYRLTARRDGEAAQLFTRNGYDWSERYPAIAAVASKLSAKSFTLDGEAVVCCADGVAMFDALDRRGRGGRGLPPLSLGERRKRLARLVARRRPASRPASTPMRPASSSFG